MVFLSFGLKIGYPARQSRQEHRLECMRKDPTYKGKCVEVEHISVLKAHHNFRQEILEAARNYRMENGMFDFRASAVYKHCVELNRLLLEVDDLAADIPSDVEQPDENLVSAQTV